MTFDEIAASLLSVLARIEAFAGAMAAWANGSADGGPEGDGRYPLPTGAATTVLVASPARLQADSSRLRVVRRVASGNVITLSAADDGLTIVCANTSPTNALTVRVPGDVTAGWCVILVQEGTGAPRVTVTVPANADGAQGTLVSFGSVFRLAGENAEAVVKCLSRDSQRRSKLLLSGNIVQ